MKKLLVLTPALIVLIIATSFRTSELNSKTERFYQGDELTLDFPENIVTILERSCFDCHSNSSKNFMSKGKLNFSKWSEYDKKKKISKLNAICEDVEDGSMPKKKYKKKHPEKVVTEEDAKLICEWVEAESNKILGE
jgi:hypothetical protein